MFLIRLSLANLLRNRKRTISTLLSIMFGISVILFSNGFATGMSRQWADSLIFQKEGHIKIRHKDFITYAASDMDRIVIENPHELMEDIKKFENVKEVMQRVVIGGLVGKDEKSTVFAGWLDDLSKLDATLPRHGREIIKGASLSPNDPDGVLLGKSLADTLGVGVGDELVIISKTRHGDQSFCLVHVRGLVEFKNNPKDEALFLLGGLSEDAREFLLDMEKGATELIVRLSDSSYVPEVVQTLNNYYRSKGEPWEAVPWYVNKEYQFLMKIFNGIAVVIMIVFSLIVSFIVSGSVIMSIMERTREIGTMRAGGFEKAQIYGLFYSETCFMLIIGSFFGLVGGILSLWTGQHTGITLANGFFEGVRPVLTLNNIISSIFFPVLISLTVAYFPIRSSCRMPIVESLNYR